MHPTSDSNTLLPDIPSTSKTMSRLPPISHLLSPPNAFSPSSPDYAMSQPQVIGTAIKDGLWSGASELAPLRVRAPLSPPVSPPEDLHDQPGQNTDLVSGNASRESGDLRDPILYPDSDSIAKDPLFDTEEDEYNRLIATHIARQAVPSKSGDPRHDAKYLPSISDYHLALSCLPKIAQIYNRQPTQYLREELTAYNTAFSEVRQARKSPSSRNNIRHGRPQQSHRSDGATVSKQQDKLARSTKVVSSPGRTRIVSKHARRTSLDTSNRLTSTSDPKSPHKRVEDTDFDALPDFSPIITTDRISLKADWPGSPVDLSLDPHKHLLHDAEVQLASTLRLSCATYICSKRRIFAGRLHAYQQGKEFRKTDAQQACKIDVNKASKLWTAFDRAGWFGRANFKQWL